MLVHFLLVGAGAARAGTRAWVAALGSVAASVG
eukprot:COSAG02_NODE_7_length_64539_cov_120.393482_8_plen_33_part_00